MLLNGIEKGLSLTKDGISETLDKKWNRKCKSRYRSKFLDAPKRIKAPAINYGGRKLDDDGDVNEA